MKSILLFFLCFFMMSKINGQRLTTKARLGLKDGNKDIVFINESFNDEFTSFEVQGDAAKSTYNATEVKYLETTDKERYVSLKLPNGRHVFMKHLEKGDINLYTYKNEYVFIQEKGAELEMLQIRRKIYQDESIGPLSYVKTDTIHKEIIEPGYFRYTKDYIGQLKLKLDPGVKVKPSLKLQGKSVRKPIAEHNRLVENENSLSFFNDILDFKFNLGYAAYLLEFDLADGERPISPLNFAISTEFSNPSLSKATAIILGYSSTFSTQQGGTFTFGAKRYFNNSNRLKPSLMLGFVTFVQNVIWTSYYQLGLDYELDDIGIYTSIAFFEKLNPFDFQIGATYRIR